MRLLAVNVTEIYCQTIFLLTIGALAPLTAAPLQSSTNNHFEKITPLVISSILFNIMIDDIFHDVPSDISRALYADDCSLWVQGRRIRPLINKLQTALNHVTSWTDRWVFIFHPTNAKRLYGGSWEREKWWIYLSCICTTSHWLMLTVFSFWV